MGYIFKKNEDGTFSFILQSKKLKLVFNFIKDYYTNYNIYYTIEGNSITYAKDEFFKNTSIDSFLENIEEYFENLICILSDMNVDVNQFLIKKD